MEKQGAVRDGDNKSLVKTRKISPGRKYAVNINRRQRPISTLFSKIRHKTMMTKWSHGRGPRD